MKVWKPLFAFAFIFVSFSAPARARIGDTEIQLTKRYGTPIRQTGGAIRALTYSFDGWLATCDFFNGVCLRVCYSKPGEWTEETFEKLLGANGDPSGWSDCGSPNLKKLTRTWKRDDGTVANWVVGSLSVTSPSYEKAKAVTEIEALMAAAST
jgi:hypothetical protein